jgi:hypothetical protein
MDRRGALAEVCVASYLNLGYDYVEATTASRVRGDIAPRSEVRATHHPTGRLILHKSDPDDSWFVLVRTHRANEGEVELVGWILAADGKQDRWWPGSVPERPCYMVPTKQLLHIDGFPFV